MIKFSFINTKDKSQLFSQKTLIGGKWGNIEVEDIVYTTSQDYYFSKLNALKENEIITDFTSKGPTDRIESFAFIIDAEGEEYKLIFTFDTFNNSNQLTVTIEYDPATTTDPILEHVKFELKKIIRPDWDKCIWLYDEQSQAIASSLYNKIYSVENLIRELVNSILLKVLGDNWILLPEFNKFKVTHKQRSGKFRRAVQNFKNVDDILISLNTDSLFEIMKTIVYEKNLILSDEDQDTIQLKERLFENKNISDSIRIFYKPKFNLWDDYFCKILPENIKTISDDFIENRNHIAHNKLFDTYANGKINDNITDMHDAIVEALSRISEIEMSKELISTIEGQEENQRIAEEEAAEREKLFYLSIKQSEANVTIRTEEEIIQFFNDNLETFYTSIRDQYYFSQTVFLGEFKKVYKQNESCEIFHISNGVNPDDTLTLFSMIETDDAEGGLSKITITVKKKEATLFEQLIQYSNGKAEHDIINSYYIPISDASFEVEYFDSLEETIIDFIENKMNSLKIMVDAETDFQTGDNPYVAGIPCWSCGEDYLSIDENIYPFGKCMNCGNENSLNECEYCGELYSEDDSGNEHLCEYCMQKIQED